MISVVVPVYNVEKYVGCCLDSIIDQTYKELEIIIVDDGSTDNSLNICKQYEAVDSRIRVIHQKNMGLASARNTGIREATGDYIYFIDSDDCINTKLFEVLIGIAEKEQANIVQIGFKNVESNFNGYNESICLEDINSHIHKMSVVDSLYVIEKSKPGKEIELSLRTIVVWTKLYRRKAFDTLLFPEGMRLHEDQMVIHRNIIKAGGIVYVDLPLHYYRKAEGSLIRIGWTPKRLSIFDCYDDRLIWLSKLSDELSEKEKIINYVYYRSLVSYFRNYDMADRLLKGKEKREVCKQIRERLRFSIKKKTGKISLSKKIFFISFSFIPKPFLLIYKVFK